MARWTSECLAATRMMTILHHGCFSVMNATNPNCNTTFTEAVQTWMICLSYIPLRFLLVPLQHAAHAQELGTESDMCSHTSGSLAAPVFCLQLCSHCCVPAAGVSDLEALVAGSRQTRANVFLFLFPYHPLYSIVQMLMIHPKGNIYTRCRFLPC